MCNNGDNIRNIEGIGNDFIADTMDITLVDKVMTDIVQKAKNAGLIQDTKWILFCMHGFHSVGMTAEAATPLCRIK